MIGGQSSASDTIVLVNRTVSGRSDRLEPRHERVIGLDRQRNRSAALQDQSDWWLGPAVHQAKQESSMPDRAENDFAIVRAVARVVPLRAVNAKLRLRPSSL